MIGRRSAMTLVALALGLAGLGPGGVARADTPARPAATRLAAPAAGYDLVGADGSVSTFGGPAYGSPAGVKLAKPVVGMATTPTGDGYDLVASDGGVFDYGDAAFHGSAGNLPLTQPIVGMAIDPVTGGYWLVAADGGVFAYDAPYFGSMGGTRLTKPVVGMAATPSGHGYYLVASDGGIFSFGDATFHGSSGAIKLVKPIVGMAIDPATGGYWLAASDGGIFSYGAPFHGSQGNLTLTRPVVGIAATADGGGYWLAASDGGVFNDGDATFLGSDGGRAISAPIVGIAATPLLRITTTTLPGGQVGVAYPSTTLSAAGGATPYTWQASGLPSGLSLSSAGLLSGMPTAAGTSNVTITVTDAAGHTATATGQLIVIPAQLSIDPPTNTSLTEDSPYSGAISASGGTPPYTFSASNLPPGISLVAGTDLLSGIPTTPGVYETTFSVTDAAGDLASALVTYTVASDS